MNSGEYSKGIARLVAIAFALIPISIWAEVTTQTVKPFKSLCISDKETGFNWTNGEWGPVNFKSNKYVLQKVDYDAAASGEPSQRPLFCRPPKVGSESINNMYYVTACYSFSKFGKPSSYIDMVNCSEIFNGGQLEHITCEGVGKFKPNGLFIKFPSSVSMDLRDTKDKDSMVLAVGTCGVM